MANTNISITIDGQEEVVATLKGISSRGKNLKPALDKAASLVITTLKANFQSNGAKLNKPWTARRYSYPWPLLNKTGRMKKSFKKHTSSKQTVISNPTPYFKYHQLGTRSLPVRSMLGVTYEDSAEIAQILTNYMMDGSK